MTQSGNASRRFPMAMRHFVYPSPVLGTSAIATAHLSGGPRFIDEHSSGRCKLTLTNTPWGTRLRNLFTGLLLGGQDFLLI